MEANTKTSHGLQPILTRVKEPSSPADMDWDKYAASVDVLQENYLAITFPAQSDSARPNSITIKTGNQAASLPSNIVIKTHDCEDRWRIDPLEYRKGYYYSVALDMPAQPYEQENLTPRRVLDQQGSNDFSTYLHETAGSPLLSPDQCMMVSSPFAAQTAQPFNDEASCRSRLSDYGYDTLSDDEDVQPGACDGDAAAGGGGCGKPEEPFEDCGFWAEVGAQESQHSPGESQATSSVTHFAEPSPHQRVEWEVNEWDSASDWGARRRLDFDEQRPIQDAGKEPVQEDTGHIKGPELAGKRAADVAVLLPWDID